jgi:predicted HicB family RNase H-like nuclease
MEFSFLKKHTRSHRFLTLLSQPEINAILDKYVPRLRSIQIFNVKEFPEVQDEYYENMDKIVEEARESLKDKLRTKIKKNVTDPVVAAAAVSQIAG